MEPSDELYETMVKRNARFDGRYYAVDKELCLISFPGGGN